MIPTQNENAHIEMMRPNIQIIYLNAKTNLLFAESYVLGLYENAAPFSPNITIPLASQLKPSVNVELLSNRIIKFTP